MEEYIEWFHFTLCNGQTIGPAALQSIWSKACESNNVSVLRTHRLTLGKRTAVYSLRASPRMQDPKRVESRLRNFMEQARLSSVLTVVQH